MKLRYTVEGKFSATFTVSVKVKDVEDARKKVVSLKLLNHKEGYMKYSGFRVYNEQNKIIEAH